MIVGYRGYKISKALNFEVLVMGIATLYNCIVTVSTFIYCDDFLVLVSEILSSSILLYMFYRF